MFSSIGANSQFLYVRFLLMISNRLLFFHSDVGPRVVYLLRDLAEMELNLQQFAARRLTQAGFTSIACPEIFRSVVVVRSSCGVSVELFRFSFRLISV